MSPRRVIRLLQWFIMVQCMSLTVL